MAENYRIVSRLELTFVWLGAGLISRVTLKVHAMQWHTVCGWIARIVGEMNAILKHGFYKNVPVKAYQHGRSVPGT